jgi:hypothetical protein
MYRLSINLKDKAFNKAKKAIKEFVSISEDEDRRYLCEFLVNTSAMSADYDTFIFNINECISRMQYLAEHDDTSSALKMAHMLKLFVFSIRLDALFLDRLDNIIKIRHCNSCNSLTLNNFIYNGNNICTQCGAVITQQGDIL